MIFTKLKITQTPEQKVWFSSDPHWNHKNICAGITSWGKKQEKPKKTSSEYLPDEDEIVWPMPYHEWKDDSARKKFCKENGLRDFASLEKMNNLIINNFNAKVRQDDILFLLGDVAFGGKENVGLFMDRLICKNVHLIFGNHDRNIEIHEELQSYFQSCSYFKEIYIDNQFITLCHYAMRVWNRSHRNSWSLYGHSHGNLPDDPNALSLDVGVDTNNLFPYSFDDVKRLMGKKTYKSVDHHGR